VKDDTVALLSGTLETVTILFLDIKGFTDFSRTKDPETVFMVLNQIFYDMARVLEKYGITVNQYLGDGFMAIVRGEEHAARAVTAALELMEAAESFNGPRIVLELPILKVRAGLNSGPVYLGNVGTYNKVDFTAVGTTTNMAARLQNEGEPGVPCISASTYEEVRGRFRFKDGNPRNVFLKGLGDHPVWDVCEGLPGGSEMVEGDLQTGLADSPDSE
jgi:class 3 adenylate cyclase